VTPTHLAQIVVLVRPVVSIRQERDDRIPARIDQHSTLRRGRPCPPPNSHAGHHQHTHDLLLRGGGLVVCRVHREREEGDEGCLAVCQGEFRSAAQTRDVRCTELRSVDNSREQHILPRRPSCADQLHSVPVVRSPVARPRSWEERCTHPITCASQWIPSFGAQLGPAIQQREANARLTGQKKQLSPYSSGQRYNRLER
jgi:hypothetical protein